MAKQTTPTDRTTASRAKKAPAPEAEPAPGQARIDLRSWMRDLETAGLLRRVKAEVDWDEEIGALARVNLALGGPALLFETIKDHRETLCTRLMTCGMATRAHVLALAGLAGDTSDKDLVRHFKEVYRKPVKPRLVETGAVKDNVLQGDAIDLGELPVPKWHASDGGRYIDTYCGVVTKDPETGRANVGLYRGMIVGRNRIAKLIIPTQGWGAHFGKHQAKAGHMPVAVVYGWHDALPFCAGSPFPKQVEEWDMIGAILGRPVDLVKCETVDLEVPADAEIVVEGFIDPDPASYEMEGPFAEYPGHAAFKASPKPVMEVTCLSYRDDPIYRCALEGARPGFPSEDSPLCAYSWSAIAWNMLEDSGVDNVMDVWMPPVTTGTNIVVQIRKRYRGHAQQVANALWGTSAGQWFFKNVMVVEEEVDIRDREALDWAMAFRIDAGGGQLLTFGPTFGSVLDPSMPPELADPAVYGSGRWTRVLFDATRNWEFKRDPELGGRRIPALNTIDPALERKIRERWPEYAIGVPYLDESAREMLTLEQLRKVFPEA
jgi:4-hydroxy-3-polyprenylbenzoate decarboxylase